MKIYRGIRLNGKIAVSVTEGSTYKFVQNLDPSPSQQLRNHSPGGFEWGYGGSGPAQLALALLLDHTGDSDTALRFYQQFKTDVVALLPHAEWRLAAGSIDGWMEVKRTQGTTEKEK